MVTANRAGGLDTQAVYKAIKSHDHEKLKTLIQNRKHINIYSTYRNFGQEIEISFLSFAYAVNAPIEIIKTLLPYTKRVEEQTYKYSTSLFSGDKFENQRRPITVDAVLKGDWELVRLFIEDRRLDLDNADYSHQTKREDRPSLIELLSIHKAPQDIIKLAEKVKLEHLKLKAQEAFNDYAHFVEVSNKRKAAADQAVIDAEEYAAKTGQGYLKPTIKKLGK